MKKFLSFILVLSLILAMTACRTTTPNTTSAITSSPAASESTVPSLENVSINIAFTSGQDSSYGSFTGGGSFTKSGEVTLEAIPIEGGGFLGWASDISGDSIKSYYNPYTFTVSEDMALYPVFIKGNEKVVLKDDVIKAAVFEQLGKVAYTYEDLQEVTMLDINWKEPPSAIEDLVYFCSLTTLFLDSNELDIDISVLANLVNIEEADLELINGVLPFENYKNLKDLTLEYSGDDVSSLVNNKDTLERLDLSYSSVKNFSFLSEMTNLKKLELALTTLKERDLDYLPQSLELLRIDGCQSIKNLNRLTRFTSLKTLYASSCFFSDITSLGLMTQLEILYLSSNFITDISPLSGLINLKRLSIDQNRLTDLSPLKPLLDKNNLEYIDVGFNQIPDYSPLKNTLAKIDVDMTYALLSQAVTAAKDIVNTLIKPNMTDYDKYKALAIGLCQSTTFSYSGYDIASTAYGALINGTAICQGYMDAYMMLCTMAGLPCYWIFGVTEDGASHGWNIVELNGNYYHVDTTWMDTGDPDYISHGYFLKSDAYFFANGHNDFTVAPGIVCDDTSMDGYLGWLN